MFYNVNTDYCIFAVAIGNMPFAKSGHFLDLSHNCGFICHYLYMPKDVTSLIDVVKDHTGKRWTCYCCGCNCETVTSIHQSVPLDSLVTYSALAEFVQTVKYCFPGLSRTCKDQIPGFSRTHKTRFRRLSRINSVHKHGCIRSKKCTYQISYQCNCNTVNKPKCINWNSNRPKR